MAGAALAITPASTSIHARSTYCRVNVTGAPSNTVTGYTTSIYPTEPAVKYYLLFTPPPGKFTGVAPDVLRPVTAHKSYIFTPSEDGKHEFNSFVFDADGTWTVDLCDAADDSVAATLSVVVI